MAFSPRTVCVSSYQISSNKRPGIDLFHTQDPGILAQTGVQLGATHVHTHHRCRTVLEQAVGETAGRLAHIQAGQARHGQANLFQSGLQLQAATGHIARLGIVQQLQRCVFGNLVTIFGNGFPFVTLSPLHTVCNQTLRLGSGAGQTTGHQELIDTHQ